MSAFRFRKTSRRNLELRASRHYAEHFVSLARVLGTLDRPCPPQGVSRANFERVPSLFCPGTQDGLGHVRRG